MGLEFFSYLVLFSKWLTSYVKQLLKELNTITLNNPKSSTYTPKTETQFQS